MGKVVPLRRSTPRVRKRDTGESGNRGEFGTVSRAEAEIALLPSPQPAESDADRTIRLHEQIEQRSGIDLSLVMGHDSATTALRINEDEGTGPARSYIESLPDAGPVSYIGAPRSPQRVAASELFSDMAAGRSRLTSDQRRELIEEATVLAQENDLIQRHGGTWDPNTVHPGQMARLRLMQVTVGVKHARGPEGLRDLTDEFLSEEDPERRERLGQVLLDEAEMAEQLRAGEQVRDFSGLRAADDGGPMYAGYAGSKYERTERVYGRELTQEIRQDLRRARQDGFIPPSYTVRVNQSGSSSMHQSINVTITPPEGHSPFFRGRQWSFGEIEEVPTEKPSDSIVRQRIETLVNSYNRDTSNSQVDYFNRKFYEHIGWSDGATLDAAD